jgi:4-hydroxybenzoate polyprenyltransferase
MLIFFSILLGGGLLYGVLFKNFTKFIPAFKDVYVSLVWALGASFLLFIYNKQDLNMLIVLVFTFLFLKSLNTSIFNDLKDIKSDGKKGLKTIPVLIGINNTITFTCLLSVITLIPLLFGVYYRVLPVYVLLFVIFTCYCIFYMLLTYKNQNNINWPQYHFLALLEKPIWPVVYSLKKLFIIFSW